MIAGKKELKNTNDRTWSFWETKEGAFEEMLEKKWDAATFLSPSVSLDFKLAPYQYKMLRSKGFYKACHKKTENQKNIKNNSWYSHFPDATKFAVFWFYLF